MSNPFKWFNDLIERSAFWYSVYVIALKFILGNFFYALSFHDQAFYTLAIIFWTVIAYVSFRFILKKLATYLRHYERLNFFLILFFVFVVPILIFYSLIYHPLLGTFVSMGVAFLGCALLKLVDNFNAKKQT